MQKNCVMAKKYNAKLLGLVELGGQYIDDQRTKKFDNIVYAAVWTTGRQLLLDHFSAFLFMDRPGLSRNAVPD